MVLAKDADTVGEELLVQGVGLNEVARRMVSVCEVVKRGESAGVVLAQDTDTVGKGLLIQGDGLYEAAPLPVCACEVVE